jgi:uncharacterized protein (UPF0305 family)
MCPVSASRLSIYKIMECSKQVFETSKLSTKNKKKHTQSRYLQFLVELIPEIQKSKRKDLKIKLKIFINQISAGFLLF